MSTLVVAVGKSGLPPFTMPDRFRHDVTYFSTPAGTGTAPPTLASGEFWVDMGEAQTILEDGVITIVSPLDSQSRTELEITEDQERWLEWMLKHQVQHVQLSAIRPALS